MPLIKLTKRNDAQSSIPAQHVKNLPAVCEKQSTAMVLQSLPEGVRKKAQERLNFVASVFDLNQRTRKPFADCCLIVSIQSAEYYPILLSAGKNGTSALTYNNFRHWCAQLGRDPKGNINLSNASALCDNYARGDRPAFGDPYFYKIFNAIYLSLNRMSAAESYKQAIKKVRAEYPLAIIPSYDQVKRQVKKLPPDTVALARYGEEAYKAKFMDYIRRDWDTLAPGEVLIGDNRTLDIFIRIPDDSAACGWRAVRPSICALIDARTWVPMGWQITADPVNGNLVAETLSLAIRNNGNRPPKVVYFDNGKDFNAQGFATDAIVDGQPHSIFRELGIRLLNAEAYNARGKTVERFFKDMMAWFDKQFPAYLGSRPGDRPANAAWHQDHPDMQLHSLRQVSEDFAEWLADYIQRPKTGNIHKGLSPAQLWQRTDLPQLTTVPLSDEQLYFAMLKPENGSRRVHRGPAVSLRKIEYYHEKLREFGNNPVMLKVDRNDLTHVYAYKADGTLVCECRTRERLNAIYAGKEELGKFIAIQRRQLRAAYTALNQLTDGLHVLSAAEIQLIDAGSRIVNLGKRQSVKGSEHNYIRKGLMNAQGQLPFACDAIDTEPLSIETEFEWIEKSDVVSDIEAMMQGDKPSKILDDDDLSELNDSITQPKTIEKTADELPDFI